MLQVIVSLRNPGLRERHWPVHPVAVFRRLRLGLSPGKPSSGHPAIIRNPLVPNPSKVFSCQFYEGFFPTQYEQRVFSCKFHSALFDCFFWKNSLPLTCDGGHWSAKPLIRISKQVRWRSDWKADRVASVCGFVSGSQSMTANDRCRRLWNLLDVG